MLMQITIFVTVILGIFSLGFWLAYLVGTTRKERREEKHRRREEKQYREYEKEQMDLELFEEIY